MIDVSKSVEMFARPRGLFGSASLSCISLPCNEIQGLQSARESVRGPLRTRNFEPTSWGVA